VLSVEGDDVTVGIVNPDGSRAEMSGNGTRIAAAWLMSRTGSTQARVHVGSRTVAVRRTEDGLYESDWGRWRWGRQRSWTASS
jgi:diaminopimelate epimerase